jgi:tetratricopeptide (TPR) repeat protein
MNKSMRTWLRLTFAGGLYLHFATAAEVRWVRMQSANFDVYSAAGERSTRETLQHFERVRGFLEQAAGAAIKPSSPVRIIVFSSKSEYDPYRPNEFATAYYHESAGRDYIVMSSSGAGTFPTAVHEYVHLAVRHARLDLPPWLNEGLAELYSTLRPLGDKVMVGELLPGRYQALQREKWVPLETILAADRGSPFYNEKNKAGSLYNEGWALTHMLALDPDYRPKYTQVLQSTQAGTDSAAVLARIYGKPFAEIEKDLQEYLRGDRFRAAVFPVKMERATEQPRAEPASMFDVKLLLANLNDRPGKEAEMEKTLEDLTREDPKRPEPYVALGNLAWLRGQMVEARKNFAKAFELGDRNPTLLWDYGRIAERDAPQESILALSELLKREPDRVDVRIELASVHLRAKRNSEVLATLAPVRTVSAENAPQFFEIMAYAQLQAGAPAEARATAQRWVSVAETPEQKLDAERLLADLENPRTPPLQGEPRLPTEKASVTGRPSVEGAFVQLDCEGAQAKVVVETAGGNKVFLIEDPDRITVGGPQGTKEMSCGPQEAVKVRIEYDLPSEPQPGIDGLLKLIRFE